MKTTHYLLEHRDIRGVGWNSISWFHKLSEAVAEMRKRHGRVDGYYRIRKRVTTETHEVVKTS